MTAANRVNDKKKMEKGRVRNTKRKKPKEN